jgi:hypothetical protein
MNKKETKKRYDFFVEYMALCEKHKYQLAILPQFPDEFDSPAKVGIIPLFNYKYDYAYYDSFIPDEKFNYDKNLMDKYKVDFS